MQLSSCFLVALRHGFNWPQSPVSPGAARAYRGTGVVRLGARVVQKMDHTFAKPLVQLPASGADWSWLAAAALHSSLEWHGAGLDLSSKSILQRMGRHCVNSSRRVWASQKMSGSGGDGEPSFMQWQGCLVGRRT